MPFKTAYLQTNEIEGGYSNDPTDKGQETYRGISRRFHSYWPGWGIIDAHKENYSGYTLSKMLDNDPVLVVLVMSFYRDLYWRSPNFHLVDVISPEIAHKLYDMGVHMGTKKVSKWLQRTINLLNRNEERYPDIIADGHIGDKTIIALRSCLDCNPVDRSLVILKSFQGAHYIEVMENNPAQEKYVGWIDRVKI